MTNELINISELKQDSISGLAKNYNLLDYLPILKELVSNHLGIKDFTNLSKPDLHRLINDVLIAKYKGEATLKSLLVNEFIEKRVVAAFEIKVNTSRVDFLTINGDTKSFEIKSELDNLNKLGKQVQDYNSVFEYNYVVIDEKHYKKSIEIIPINYGIWSFVNGKKIELKKATLNQNLFSDLQLKLFTKKELMLYYPMFNGQSDKILSSFDQQEINKTFKLMLKKRYTQRWQFLKTNKNEILPIDYQFFFNKNIEPNIIYC